MSFMSRDDCLFGIVAPQCYDISSEIVGLYQHEYNRDITFARDEILAIGTFQVLVRPYGPSSMLKM